MGSILKKEYATDVFCAAPSPCSIEAKDPTHMAVRPYATSIETHHRASTSRDSTTFRMNADRPAQYDVHNLRQPVFSPDEPVLAAVLTGRKVLLIADRAVFEHFGESILGYLTSRAELADSVVLDGSEHEKTLQAAERVCAAAFQARIDRHGVFLAVGGGVVLDVAGTAASLYRRGVAYVRVPTSLIGMVDVAVGIKQGVNFAGRKNALGAFYPPVAALCHRSFLRSLPPRHIAAGLAEIIKMGVIADADLFETVEQTAGALLRTRFQEPADLADEIIARAQLSMMDELEPNLYETNMRRLADFGHTFSPTLETKSEHRLSHGEAVAVDMLLSTAISALRSLCAASTFRRLCALYRAIGLPLSDPLCTPALLTQAMHETRCVRAGELNLVAPSTLGSGVFIQDVSDDELVAAIALTQKESSDAGVATCTA